MGRPEQIETISFFRSLGQSCVVLCIYISGMISPSCPRFVALADLFSYLWTYSHSLCTHILVLSCQPLAKTHYTLCIESPPHHPASSIKNGRSRIQIAQTPKRSMGTALLIDHCCLLEKGARNAFCTRCLKHYIRQASFNGRSSRC